MKEIKWKSVYFFGNKVSDYGIENGYIDYSTLAKSFNHVLNNDIMGELMNKGYDFDIVNGNDYDDETDSYEEVFQYYIIDQNGFEILFDFTDEIVYYNEDLDMYIWGVTHYGTSWDYVLTDIKIDEKALQKVEG